MMHDLRRAIPVEEFCYSFLMSHLGRYSKPRDKVTRLLKSGAIIRVKKGLYIFGEDYRRGLLCPELLANLIYGPSYVSLEYALAYYGMIPEEVHLVTSITLKRKKFFETPIGNFSYRHLHQDKYPVGITFGKADRDRSFYIAAPEKAVADLVAPITEITSAADVQSYLLDHMRVDATDLYRLNLADMQTIAEDYSNHRVTLLLEHLRAT